MRISRREFVIASPGLAVATTACLFSGKNSDLVVGNHTNATVQVSIRVVRVDTGDVLFGDATAVDPDESEQYTDPIPEGRAVTIRVSTNDQSDSVEWEQSTNAEGLFIFVRSDSIEFQEVEY